MSKKLQSDASEVDRRTLDERVYEQMRLAIMGGAFRPGQTLTLRGLAEAFGTSLMPVRNAVSRLSVEHALVVRPNTSIRVPRLTTAEFDEVTDIRLALEPMSARLAVQNIDEAAITQLEVVGETMKVKRGAAYLRDNFDFHFGLYSFAQRPTLERMIQSSWLRVGPLFHSIEDAYPGLPNAHHDALTQALRRSDPLGAAAAVAEDIRDAARILRTFIANQADA